MTQYIQFQTEDGSSILVEVEETHGVGIAKAGLRERAGEAVAQATTAFEEGLEIVRRNAAAFVKTLRGLSDQPDEIEVTFGLKATGEVGNFAVAKAGAEANYSVKLTWKRKDQAGRRSQGGAS